jgi:hypothetical protein
MTPRERILATLEHREPDRVAIDFGGTDCSSVHLLAYDHAVFDRWDWSPGLDEPLSAYGERARRLRAATDRAIVASWRMHYLQCGGLTPLWLGLSFHKPSLAVQRFE